MVAGFVVRDVRSRGIQYRFMRVSRFLVTVAFCLVLLAGVGRMSLSLAVLAIKLLLVGSSFLGCVAFLVASIASLYTSALVLFFFPNLLLELTIMALASEAVALSYLSLIHI